MDELAFWMAVPKGICLVGLLVDFEVFLMAVLSENEKAVKMVVLTAF